MKLNHILYYLLLIFLPVQLGRHFFPDFALIAGIRSDYLSPTIFLTDLLILLMLAVEVIGFLQIKRGLLFTRASKSFTRNSKRWYFFLALLLYLVFTSLFIAANPQAALYKLLKITEYAYLVSYIIRLKPKLLESILSLSVGVYYSSVVAIWQFLAQSSIGGLFWWLGERSFNLSTPGIAKTTINGAEMLRPYATFPHPNVLGGFLAVMLPVILAIMIYHRDVLTGKLYLYLNLTLVLGLFALVFTFSRTAWVMGAFGFGLVFLADPKIVVKTARRKIILLSVLYVILLLSVLTPFILPQTIDSFKERSSFISTAFEMIRLQPVFGYGLNNFIVNFHEFVPPTAGIYIFQPLHNMYLLIFLETGLWGLITALILFSKLYLRSAKSDYLVFIGVVQLLLLGLFDHYLVTLQQGQLLLTVFTSLALTPEHNQV
ncbi:hypothetical protein A3D03_00280 [Candidatus Gottesmanbacteria bacterium RIFCSPHIGHO2_02_FULL_40_13]|uniref:O-antigen ligase-related domain-containing protein n=1 Tax=Candidatus Gottesmanbacteria bacterium RIFCSPHIGHO2_02_FULL_40_13 TaxID=1798384 RepID=A0A1F6AD11_9BACT|nr:MAG: hypothetical protein A3D03_00280 [Candidatus Gottesmanbacteria bacterium RIFCSPHIGHO2_02_FULL_40_13]